MKPPTIGKIMNLSKLKSNKYKVVLLCLVIVVFYHLFETTKKEGQTYYSNFDEQSTEGSGMSTPETTARSSTAKPSKKSAVTLFDSSFVNESKKYIKKFIHDGTVEGWDYNTSRDTSLYIQPENITTVLLPEKFCASPTSLLIIICSSPGNFTVRNVIRETWALTRNVTNFSIDIYFLVGQVNNITIQEQIEQEFSEKNDLVQEHFIDSYNNLTIKSLMMLKLVKSHCMNTVKFVMKTDDDVYVNIPPLVNYLRVNGTKNLLMGYLMRGATPVRDRKSKWNAPHYLYNGTRYPHYLSGTGYVMSIDIVPSLYAASFRTSIFYLEDVYITGILSEAIRLKPRDHSGFTYRKRDFSPCTYQTAITTHRLNETEIRDLYALIRKTDFRKCKRKPPPKSKFISIFGLLDIYL